MILIVADDITGAAEIAGICLRYNMPVLFGLDQIPAGEARVKVVATNSRSATLAEARQIHAALALEIKQQQPEFVFKKCDSVLRGYIQAETDALSSELGITQVVLQPANPAANRIIRSGTYFIGDQLLHETAFAADPDFPAMTSGVRALLDNNSGVNGDKQGTSRAVSLLMSDCCTVEDLANQAESIRNDRLVVGSSAFFEQLILQKYPEISVAKSQEATGRAEEFLMIIGSTHATGREFIENSKQDVSLEIIREKDLADEQFALTSSRKSAMLQEKWSVSHRMIVSFAPDVSAVKAHQQKYLVRSFTLLKGLLENPALQQIFVTGGATAYSMLKFMGRTTLTPLKEHAPGVVTMQAAETAVRITMKPGSYPWPGSIV